MLSFILDGRIRPFTPERLGSSEFSPDVLAPGGLLVQITGSPASVVPERRQRSLPLPSRMDDGDCSAEHHEKFAGSLANTGANENQIRGRLAAARSEGTHPSAAVTPGKGATKARKTRQGTAVLPGRGKNGLTR